MKEEEIKRLEEKVEALQDEINRIKNSKILSCAGSTNVPLHAGICKDFENGNGLAQIKINGKWAYSIFESTNRSHNNDSINGKALLFLADYMYTWTTEDGTVIKGYLTYTPKGEN